MNGRMNQAGRQSDHKSSRRSDRWHKSAACMSSPNCVEIAIRTDGVAVRDSKDPGGPVLEFTAAEWTAFLAGVRDGQFDCQA